MTTRITFSIDDLEGLEETLMEAPDTIARHALGSMLRPEDEDLTPSEPPEGDVNIINPDDPRHRAEAYWHKDQVYSRIFDRLRHLHRPSTKKPEETD